MPSRPELQRRKDAVGCCFVKKTIKNLLVTEPLFPNRAVSNVGVGERAKVVKHHDNLKMEGSFQGLTSESKSAQKAITKVNYNKAAKSTRYSCRCT